MLPGSSTRVGQHHWQQCPLSPHENLLRLPKKSTQHRCHKHTNTPPIERGCWCFLPGHPRCGYSTCVGNGTLERYTPGHGMVSRRPEPSPPNKISNTLWIRQNFFINPSFLLSRICLCRAMITQKARRSMNHKSHSPLARTVPFLG